mmetsp:Transcript_51983/g.86461  ORF Transcript_51983/g.86461 Transcript_51983/m.86461 type:complete len:90 (-) Transcript_51983:8-277(-)
MEEHANQNENLRCDNALQHPSSKTGSNTDALPYSKTNSNTDSLPYFKTNSNTDTHPFSKTNSNADTSDTSLVICIVSHYESAISCHVVL